MLREQLGPRTGLAARPGAMRIVAGRHRGRGWRRRPAHGAPDRRSRARGAVRHPRPRPASATGAGLRRSARVLDAFAGTGALGLEALSRGAADALPRQRATALDCVRRNAAALGEAARSVIVQADATAPPAPASARPPRSAHSPLPRSALPQRARVGGPRRPRRRRLVRAKSPCGRRARRGRAARPAVRLHARRRAALRAHARRLSQLGRSALIRLNDARSAAAGPSRRAPPGAPQDEEDLCVAERLDLILRVRLKMIRSLSMRYSSPRRKPGSMSEARLEADDGFLLSQE